MRTRDGRALVAVRDHYLSAEIMGINLAYYRTLSFGIASFYAGIGGALYAHYLQFVSVEAFNILFSIQFLGMVIIGGLGSIMGSLMGAAFMVLLPEVVQSAADADRGQRDRPGAQDRRQHLLPARDGDRRRHHPVPHLRAGRAGATLEADQGLLEALPLFPLTTSRETRPKETTL